MFSVNVALVKILLLSGNDNDVLYDDNQSFIISKYLAH